MYSVRAMRPGRGFSWLFLALSLGPCSEAVYALAPAITISTPSVAATNTGPVKYTITYAGATNITLADTDVGLNKPDGVDAKVQVSGEGTNERTVTISNITGDGTLSISILAGTATDGTDLAEAAGPSDTFTVDNTKPTVAIGDPSAASSNGTTPATITYTLTYTGASTVTLGASDVTLKKTGTATGTVSVSGTGTATRTVTISTIRGVGTLGISIAAGTASDDAGNKADAPADSKTFEAKNTTYPALMISAPSVSNATTGPVTFTVTYTGASAITLSASNISLNKAGAANGIVSVSGTGTSQRTVTISDITGAGGLGISVAVGSARNTSGALAPAAGPSLTFNANLDQPSITISAPSTTIDNIGPVSYTVTYLGADSVTLSASDVILNKVGADGEVEVTGSGATTRTVTIKNITGTGTLGISLEAGTAADRSGHQSLAAGPSATFNVDPAPVITIGKPSRTTTTTGPVTYTITYKGASGVSLATSNITLSRTGTATGSVAVSGSGTTARTVTVSSITGAGSLGISVAAGTANDGAGHNATAAGPSATFAVANTAPAIAIIGPSVATTAAGPVEYTVNYSGVTSISLGATNVTLNKAPGQDADGTVTVSGTGTSSRKVAISNITGNGTLSISIASGTAANSARVKVAAAGPSTAFTVYSVPGVTISDPSTTLTNTGPVTYTVTYAQAAAVTLAAKDINLNSTGTAHGEIAVSGSDTNTRTVTISNITGNGTLGISLDPDTARDKVDHPAPASNNSKTFNVHAGPLVSIGDPSGPTTNGTSPATVSYTITYKDATTVTLSEADIALNKTGTAGGTVAVTDGQVAGTRVVTISNITGKGTLGISLAAATASDVAGNTCLAAGPSKTFTTTNPAPAMVISGPSAATTVKGPISYSVSYSGVTTVALSTRSITLNKTGSANGTIAVSGTGATSRTVTVSNITGHGTLSISIAAGTGSSGNLTAPAAGPSKTFEVDLAAPYVTISDPSAWLTRTGPITYTVTYVGASNVTLTAADIALNKTGGANAATVTVDGEGTSTRTVTIDNITGTGTLGISIRAGTAARASGTKAPTVGPSEIFYTNLTAPAIEISAPSVAWSNGTVPVVYTVTYFGASDITLDASDITLNRGVGSTASGTGAVSGTDTTTRLVTISNIKGAGALGITIGAGTAVDADGNKSGASDPSPTFTAANIAPAVVISDPSATSTTTNAVTYTINYSGVSSYKFDDPNYLAANIARYVKLNSIGTATGTVTVTGTGATRTVKIDKISGAGSLGISLLAGSASNSAKQLVGAAGPSTTFLVNVAAPTAFISAPSTLYTATGPVTYTVDYLLATDVTVKAADITLNKTGTADGTVAVTGNGTSRTVTISSISGTGTLGISIAKDTGSGAGGVKTDAAGPSTTFNVHPAPTITIGNPSVNMTTTGPVTYTITYSDATAVNLTPAKITLNKKGTANGRIAISGGDTTTRTVTVSGITGTGTLGISIAAGTASDSVNHVDAIGAGPSKTFNVNLSAPSVSISAPSPANTNEGPVAFTVSYMGADTITLDEADITPNKTGTVAVGTVAVTGTGTDTRTVTLSDITGAGTLGISIAAGTAKDRSNPPAAAAAKTSSTATIDDTAPTVSIGAPSKAATNSGPVTYTVTYSGASAITLKATDIALVKVGTADGMVAVSGTSPTSRTVTISGIHGEGSLGITIADGTATDPAGNLAAGAVSGTTFAVDNTAPTITVGDPSKEFTNTGPVTYTVTYSDASNITLKASDITLDKGNSTVNGTVTVSGTGNETRTVTIDNITGNGILGISIKEGTGLDAAGNKTPAIESDSFVVDNTNPTVTIGAPSKSITNTGSVTFTITYTGATTITLQASDITPNTTGGVTAGRITVDGSGSSTRTVTIDNISGDGAFGITIAAGTATDAAGNSAPAPADSATFNVDNTPPTISIGEPSALSAAAGPITYTITYTGAVTPVTLDATKIHLDKTGDADATTVTVDGTDRLTPTVTIDGITGNGTIAILSIDAGTATDAAGNAAPAAGPSTPFDVAN